MNSFQTLSCSPNRAYPPRTETFPHTLVFVPSQPLVLEANVSFSNVVNANGYGHNDGEGDGDALLVGD